MFRKKIAGFLAAGLISFVVGNEVSRAGGAYRSVPAKPRSYSSRVDAAPSSFPEVRFLTRRVVFRDAEGQSANSTSGSQDRAYFTVNLPADAELWINDVKTAQQGNSHKFNTPPLGNSPYRYQVRARWLENGKEVVRSRTFEVRVGATTNVDLLAPDTNQATISSNR